MDAAANLRKRLNELDAILAGAIVVDRAGHAVAFAVGFLDLEAHASMESNRAEVYRGGDAAHSRAAALAGGGKEALVQLAPEPMRAVRRVDADKVDVRLAGIGLRDKAGQKRE